MLSHLCCCCRHLHPTSFQQIDILSNDFFLLVHPLTAFAKFAIPLMNKPVCNVLYFAQAQRFAQKSFPIKPQAHSPRPSPAQQPPSALKTQHRPLSEIGGASSTTASTLNHLYRNSTCTGNFCSGGSVSSYSSRKMQDPSHSSSNCAIFSGHIRQQEESVAAAHSVRVAQVGQLQSVTMSR
jgi:hypothetical protein